MGSRYPNQPEVVRIGPSTTMITARAAAEQFGFGTRKMMHLLEELGVPLTQDDKFGDKRYFLLQAFELALFSSMLPDAFRRCGPDMCSYLKEVCSLSSCIVSTRDVDERLEKVGWLLRNELRRQSRSSGRVVHPRPAHERGGEEHDGQAGESGFRRSRSTLKG